MVRTRHSWLGPGTHGSGYDQALKVRVKTRHSWLGLGPGTHGWG